MSRANRDPVICHNCNKPYHGAVSGPCPHCHIWVKLPRLEKKTGGSHVEK